MRLWCEAIWGRGGGAPVHGCGADVNADDVCGCVCVWVCVCVAPVVLGIFPQVEGMEKQIAAFFRLVQDFRQNRHDLLAFESNDFDRRFLEFNARVLVLEGELQVGCVCQLIDVPMLAGDCWGVGLLPCRAPLR
jgi:hypothetical protein